MIMFQSLSKEIDKSYRQKESICIRNLSSYCEKNNKLDFDQIKSFSSDIINKLRSKDNNADFIESLIKEYDLLSREGVALMSIAESLLRIPDGRKANDLIYDKVTSVDWYAHLDKSKPWFTNLATWTLHISKKILLLPSIFSFFAKPIIRLSIKFMMHYLGSNFVLAQNIKKGVKKANINSSYIYSFDMLGESARTDVDAKKYYKAYIDSIHALSKYGNINANKETHLNSGISVKLSALDPRYEILNTERTFSTVYTRLKSLMILAKQFNIPITIDAEESERLELSLNLIKALCSEPELESWSGIGLAVQAYQKRAFFVIDWLAKLAKSTHRRISVRLVKGAYWDTEIKRHQELGLKNYPVFTRKVYTDVSYTACAKKLFKYSKYIYPQFATHNSTTIATVVGLAGTSLDYEFQCLHGMGHNLYNILVKDKSIKVPCRIYAPVGGHKHLLSYLIRRLLENGANSSFVNKIMNEKLPIDILTSNPLEKAMKNFKFKPHPSIPLPDQIYSDRVNAKGVEIDHYQNIQKLENKIEKFLSKTWTARSILGIRTKSKESIFDVTSPADKNKKIGTKQNSPEECVDEVIDVALYAFKSWSKLPIKKRTKYLRDLADLIEKNTEELIALLMLEGGKVLSNAISEIREAVDFCRYYASDAETKLDSPVLLKGITGEENWLSYEGKGVIACISPWNFPLAIFIGQIAAALVTGNTVIAKPATQTTLISHAIIQLCHKVGIPRSVLQLILGGGGTIGKKLAASPKISGVMFTGSTSTAKSILRDASATTGPIPTLIAETGGLNCMIVDSTALLEQVVKDVITSAFDSAGQRCSALRVVYIQKDIANELIKMLTGAMDCLNVSEPWKFDTDIGPIIDYPARKVLEEHIERCEQKAKILKSIEIGTHLTGKGSFFGPTIVEIKNLKFLPEEVFGPILHIIRYKASNIDNVVDQINSSGYGLTFGVHSRIEQFCIKLKNEIKVGNVYVNRNIIGAVVGAQPFGGVGLSGTGPKAGGPNYLYRLMNEKVTSVNTTATGGNVELLSLNQDE